MQNSTFLLLAGICVAGYLLYIQPPLNNPAGAPAPVARATEAAEANTPTNAMIQPATSQSAQTYQQATENASPSPFATTPGAKHHSTDDLLKN